MNNQQDQRNSDAQITPANPGQKRRQNHGVRQGFTDRSSKIDQTQGQPGVRIEKKQTMNGE